MYTDPGPGFQELVNQFPGVILDTGGAKDNVAKVDIKIRRIKELCQSVQAGLAWPVPKTMVKDLVSSAVSKLNIRRTTALHGNVCPHVLFTGIKVDYLKELELEFGTYVKVYDGTDNASKTRSIPCIALYPCSNSTGSWEFMNLKTKTRVRRSHWVKMKTSELIVKMMTSFDQKAQMPETWEQVVEVQVPQSEDTGSSVEQGMPEIVVATETPVVAESSSPASAELKEETDVAAEEMLEQEADPPVASRTRQQTSKSILRPGKYSLATKLIDKRSEKDPVKLAAIKTAEVEEIKQVFEGLKAVETMHEEDVERRAHGCHMFTVDKFLADGTFDKCKGRVVLHGNEQDPEMYPDRSTPTAAVHSIFTCLAVAAFHNIKEVAKIDVKGVFIQTPMEGPHVYMRCNRDLTKLIVEVYPHLQQFVSKNGFLYCRLLKALYGCVQASKLWYDKLIRFLRSAHREIVNGKVRLLLVYVDDILVIAERAEIERLQQRFVNEFTWITIDIGKKYSYLGMQICFEDGCVLVDMIHYIDKMLDAVDGLVECSVPANKKIFVVDEQSPLLTEQERKQFHTLVAKLLFLSKRARLDISASNGFLCTRVTKATEEDKRKLYRLLGFLNRTRTRVLKLRPRDLRLLAYINVAFASHYDSKSHTGVVIFRGGALAFIASRKQKCVTKSPTESELVGLTDYVGLVEAFTEFVAFVTNSSLQIPLIFQDSTSVISLVTRGG